MKLRHTSAYIIILLLLSNIAFAQSELKGVITDIKGNTPVKSATIQIPDLKIQASTNASGLFDIKDLSSGTYLVVINKPGYSTIVKTITIKGVTELNEALKASTAELSEVVVTGVSTATEQRKNPVPVGVMTHNELQQTAATNIIDAITYIPGVSAITDGPAISKPVIRGLGYNRVVVMSEGVRQEGQQWGDEFGIEVDEYAVDKVEVLKGPGTLSYGSDAMAGVINFLPVKDLEEGKIKGDVTANYQTNNGLMAASADIQGNLKGFVWDARYTFKQAHAYQNKYDDYVWNSGYGENDFRGMIGLNRSWGYSHLSFSAFDLKLGIVEGSRDTITGQFQKHYLDMNGGDSLGVAPSGDYKKYGLYPIIHQHIRHYKTVWDNSILLGSAHLNVKLGLQQNYRQEANDITLGDVYNNYFYLNTVNYDVQYVFPERNHFNLSVGVNGMSQSSEDRGSVYLVPEYNLFDIGLFAIAKKTFNKLSVSGGLRYDSRSLHGNDLYTDSLGARTSASASDATHRFYAYYSNFTGVSGSIGAAYDINRNWYAKLNISRGFRAPNIAESGSNGIHDGTTFYEIGDPTLKPETSLQIDGTIGYKNEDLTAELDAFTNQINNYIFAVKLSSVVGGDSLRNDPTTPFGPSPTFKYISGDASISGAELMVNIHPRNLSWLHFDNTFSMISAIQKGQGDSTKYLPYTPPFKLQSKLVFTAKKLNKYFTNAFLSIGYEYDFKQDKVYYKFGDETVTPSYSLINASIGTDICSNNKTICSLYIIGNNLADEAYQSNMDRLKYGDLNVVTGRTGVYKMGRNISIKLIIPLDLKNK
ncbi:MAG: TonB-dependent receptor [Bacteroidota bacterium]